MSCTKDPGVQCAVWAVALCPHHHLSLHSSSQSQSAYIIRNPQQRRISQSQPVRGRDEEQDDIVSADVEEVEVVEGVAGEEDHHDEQEEHGEENAEAEGHHDEHDEDGM